MHRIYYTYSRLTSNRLHSSFMSTFAILYIKWTTRRLRSRSYTTYLIETLISCLDLILPPQFWLGNFFFLPSTARWSATKTTKNGVGLVNSNGEKKIVFYLQRVFLFVFFCFLLMLVSVSYLRLINFNS